MKFRFPSSSPKSQVASQQAVLNVFAKFGNHAAEVSGRVRLVKIKALKDLRIQLNVELRKIGKASHSKRFDRELKEECAKFKVAIETAAQDGNQDAFAETLGALYRSYDGACGGRVEPTPTQLWQLELEPNN
jgi:hypothetical protein